MFGFSSTGTGAGWQGLGTGWRDGKGPRGVIGHLRSGKEGVLGKGEQAAVGSQASSIGVSLLPFTSL